MRLLQVFLLTLAVSAACGQSGGTSYSASLGQQAILGLGQEVNYDNGELKFRFLEVTEDNRCPKGVVCAQAGRATAIVEAKTPQRKDNVRLIISGQTQRSVGNYAGYSLTFSLAPYPGPGKSIPKGEYRLSIQASK